MNLTSCPADRPEPHAALRAPRQRAMHARPVRSEPTELANAAMERYARGDAEAFAQLYRLLQPRLYRRCRQLAGAAEAEELVQEVFLKMHRARESFVPQGSVVAWAYSIVLTTSRDRLRRRARRPEAIQSPELLEGRPADRSATPESGANRRALESLVQSRLTQLSANQRGAFVLVKFEGLSCATAAQRLGISTNAVKQRVHRATEELRSALFQSGWTEGL